MSIGSTVANDIVVKRDISGKPLAVDFENPLPIASAITEENKVLRELKKITFLMAVLADIDVHDEGFE